MTLYSSEDYLESPDFPFHINIYKINRNEIIEDHSHEFIEFAFISEGIGEHTYRGSSYSISNGDVFVIEPGISHAYRVGYNSEVYVYNVLFQPSLLMQELESLTSVTSFVNFFYVEPLLRKTVNFQSHLRLQPQEQLEIKLLLDRLLKEYKQKGLGYQVLVKTILIEIFILLSRCYDRRLHKPMTFLASENEIMERISQFIELHHAQPLTLQQVSQLCGMSLSAFTTKFRQYKGLSFVEYRNQIRLSVAEDLLVRTDRKITDIMSEVGFEDLSHFIRMFKQFKGATPGQYRKLRSQQVTS